MILTFTRETFTTPIDDGLTDKQRDVYLFMLDFQRLHGLPPTFQEIGDAFGFKSRNGTSCHVKAIAKKGYIKSYLREPSAPSAGRHVSRGYVAIDPANPEACTCCGQALPQAPKGGE